MVTITIICTFGAVLLAGVTAFSAALGLVGVTPRFEQLLFVSAVGEFITAIGTFERLVLKRHRVTSSLLILIELRSPNYEGSC
jgi:hypothetical protein